eukprot:TRINITY_DN14350_c0_g1_i1.p1 TRINITY_DN14350_c0_g1~~TRINITY_DN14350_c0_g1_i1.p1  ORF type:complete len:207 (+),score=27.04 TRINITY_DN14350_c0_g1_i1:98-718(+)
MMSANLDELSSREITRITSPDAFSQPQKHAQLLEDEAAQTNSGMRSTKTPPFWRKMVHGKIRASLLPTRVDIREQFQQYQQRNTPALSKSNSTVFSRQNSKFVPAILSLSPQPPETFLTAPDISPQLQEDDQQSPPPVQEVLQTRSFFEDGQGVKGTKSLFRRPRNFVAQPMGKLEFLKEHLPLATSYDISPLSKSLLVQVSNERR